MIRVCILSDFHDWHSEQIRKALKNNGIKVSFFSFSDFLVRIKKNNNYFYLNQSKAKFDGFWVRFIGAGSLEEITFKLSILHFLKDTGIYIHNSGETIEKTVDKFRTTSYLRMNNIKTPDTWITGEKKKFDDICLKLIQKKNIILTKPLFGSQGKGIEILKQKDDVINFKSLNNVYYFQKFIGKINQDQFSDLRVLVSNHRVISVIRRTSSNLITNYYQGASIKKIESTEEINKISKKISKVFKLGYGGIDIKVFGKKLYVLEVNSIPSWKGLQEVEDKNIAQIIVKDFINNIKKNAKS